LDESLRITQQILLALLEGDHNVSAIKNNTGLHPKTLSIYLKRLIKQKLIEVEIRGWKRGKSKPYSITDAGIKWLTDIPLNETLEVLSRIASQLRKPLNREAFRNVRAERYSRDKRIIGNYFIERLLKGDKSPIEYPEGLDSSDENQLFREALKKLLALHLYLISDPGSTPDEVERGLEEDFILFAPHMTFEFSWHPGAFPELEYQLQRVESYLRRESRKSQAIEGGERVSGQSHLLGLEKVDEKLYEEYVKATDEGSRKRIMAKIEDEVGWSVGTYLRELLIGKEEEIAKYMDELQRPSLRRFISLFQCGSK
jgi:DNA-binding PadR family transcriptional regulator